MEGYRIEISALSGALANMETEMSTASRISPTKRRGSKLFSYLTSINSVFKKAIFLNPSLVVLWVHMTLLGTVGDG